MYESNSTFYKILILNNTSPKANGHQLFKVRKSNINRENIADHVACPCQLSTRNHQSLARLIINVLILFHHYSTIYSYFLIVNRVNLFIFYKLSILNFNAMFKFQIFYKFSRSLLPVNEKPYCIIDSLSKPFLYTFSRYIILSKFKNKLFTLDKRL
jgi:hypothetical protein